MVPRLGITCNSLEESTLWPSLSQVRLWTDKHNVETFHLFIESATIDDFGHKMSLHRTDVEHLRSVFMAVENGDIGMLKSLGIRVSKMSPY